MSIMAVRTVPAFTAAEYAGMAADQARMAQSLRRKGNTADAEVWQRWSEQTARQAADAAAPGLTPLTEDEWDGS